MRSLVIAICLFASCQCCDAQILPRRASGFDPNAKVDGHNAYNMGRVPELPSGPNKLDCWVVLSDNWQSNPLEYAIAQAIANDPRMKSIKAGTYWNYYTVSNPKFSQSGLIAAVGTATPIFVVARHDGAIRADGSGGLLVNAKSAPATAAECVDMLCDAIAEFNPPPVVEGQTNATPIIRDTIAEQCTPDTCPPPSVVIPNPLSYDGALPTIRPRKTVNGAWAALAGVVFCAGCGALLYLGIATPGKKKVV